MLFIEPQPGQAQVFAIMAFLAGNFFLVQTNGRYGCKGKENDNEVKGEGNQQDYGIRIYDPRIGKFLSVDPLANEYCWNSTYCFAENDVIRSIDLEGMEKLIITEYYNDRNQKIKSVLEGIRDIQTKQAVDMHMKSRKDIGLTTEDVYIIRRNTKGKIFFEGPAGRLTNSQKKLIADAKIIQGDHDENLPQGTMIRTLKTTRGDFYESDFLKTSENEFFEREIKFAQSSILVPKVLASGLQNLFLLGIKPTLPGGQLMEV